MTRGRVIVAAHDQGGERALQSKPMTHAAERPPQDVLDYVAVLTDGLLSAVGGEVCAVYLHGSAVLGGWRAAVSDVDVLVIVPGHLGPARASAVSSAALSTVSVCPGTGLELSAVTGADAAAPGPPWRFVTHVAATKAGERRVVLGATHPGDSDLLLHYAVCRQAGWPALGPPATELIGPISRAQVLKAQARELAWGLARAPSHYTLLTACRALNFLQHRELVGKTTAARWAIDQGVGPSASIAEALATQTGVRPPGSLTAVDVAFIRHTASKLAIAAQAEQASSR